MTQRSPLKEKPGHNQWWWIDGCFRNIRIKKPFIKTATNQLKQVLPLYINSVINIRKILTKFYGKVLRHIKFLIADVGSLLWGSKREQDGLNKASPVSVSERDMTVKIQVISFSSLKQPGHVLVHIILLRQLKSSHSLNPAKTTCIFIFLRAMQRRFNVFFCQALSTSHLYTLLKEASTFMLVPSTSSCSSSRRSLTS